MTTICGQVYVLGDHVDTDQILTAEFMKINPATAEGYQQLGALALCGLPDSYPPFINPDTGKARYPILVAGENFGCGSSREHAPIALGSAGVQAVIAQSFARIFFRNCIATGELLPIELRERLCDRVQTGDEIEIVLDQQQVRVPQVGDLRIQPLGALVEVVAAGGLFAYARQIGKTPVL